MKRITIISFCLMAFNMTFAQEDCACCSEPYKQFDFWVGDWNVYNEEGEKVGENLIEKLESGCILNENWKGAKGGSGKSYNYYNKSDSSWHQLWIDSSGGSLDLTGYAEENKMILKGKLQKGQRVPLYANRITWTKNEDGSVTQLWEILDDKDSVLNVAFKGIYRRK